jgi:acyl carrier protein
MYVAEDIYGRVSHVLMETLNVDEEDLTPTATLQGDLGAESIDFLDLVFRLEREFGIDIAEGELFPDSIFQGNPDFVQEGKVTEQGMEELRSRMPYADLRSFDQDRRLSGVADLFTVDLVARYITWKLGQGAGAQANGIGAARVTPNSPLAH